MFFISLLINFYFIIKQKKINVFHKPTERKENLLVTPFCCTAKVYLPPRRTQSNVIIYTYQDIS